MERLQRVLKQAERFRANRERRSWQTTHRIADRHVPRVVSTLILEIRNTRRDVNLAALTRAVASGNVKGVEDALLIERMDANLKRNYSRQIRGVLNEAGAANVRLQPRALAGVFGRFDLTNPRAVQWANEKAATLVREVTEGQKATIRRVIAQGIDQGVPARSTGRRLRSAIGLTVRQWESVQNFQQKRLIAGDSIAQAELRAEKFAAKVHRRRAEVIARTETIDASVQGRLELWDQAEERGLIEGDATQRKWIVTPDDRLDSIICAPMSGQIRGLREPFLTGDGRLVMRPTAHPNCRCDVILIIPGTSVFEDVPEPEGRRRSRAAGLAAAAAAAALASRDAGGPAPGEES